MEMEKMDSRSLQNMVVHMFAAMLAVSLEHLNQHQQSSQTQTAWSNNSDSDGDTNTLRITEPLRQKLTATNPSKTSSDSENEHTGNYESLNLKYHSKEIISDAEDLSLSLPSQLSTPQKKTTNINKEPKKDMIKKSVWVRKLYFINLVGKYYS